MQAPGPWEPDCPNKPQVPAQAILELFAPLTPQGKQRPAQVT